MFGLRAEERGHRRNAEAREALLHPLADAGDVPQGQLQQRPGHVVRMPDHVAVRLARLAGHLCKLAVGRESDRAGDEGADIVGNAFFDPQTQRAGIDGFRGREAARQFVDGLDRVDGNDGGNFGQQRVVRPAVEIGRLRHQDDAGATFARLLDIHDVFHAMQFGLARAGDDTGVPGVLERHHPDGLAAQMRVRLLLDRCEEAVEIKVKPFDFKWLSHNFSASFEQEVD